MNKDIEYNELIIGVITTVGVCKNDLIQSLIDALAKFHYTVEEISVTKYVIDEVSGKFDSEHDEFKRIQHYMNEGNRIRKESKDNSILMRGAVSKIFSRRDCKDGHRMPSNRKAYIINSIKHPDEVDFLRNVYRDAFFLIGFTTSEDRRLKYLKDRKHLDESQAKQILDRDQYENCSFGQHVREAFQMADFFVTNCEHSDHISNMIDRFIDLIFGDPFITPSFEEYAMFMAYANSLRTADLSRQIGAVITKYNEVLASGSNDCPKFGGGLYWPIKNQEAAFIDEENGRDYKRKYDPNKDEQAKIINAILTNLEIDVNDKNISLVKDSGIGDLTEYGRVVHSEMEALMFCARNNISCRGADMYVTTFPCHNCAKHIIAAGIRKVIYIEPYPKSKALDLYKNEITTHHHEKEKVQFIMFEGVGPQRYQDLFAMNSTKLYKRKRKQENGAIITWDRNMASPRYVVPLVNYIEVEKKEVINYEKFKEIKETENNNMQY